jgi:hypothetical protein
MEIKKIFNYEEVLTSDEFIAQKQDTVSSEKQSLYPSLIVKVYTYCKEDKKFVIHTTEENRAYIGASDKKLAHRPVSEQSLMTLDNEMTNTYEIIIKANTTIADYITAKDIAQSKADEMFENDKTKMPIVTVIDYRWGNPVSILVPTAMGVIDQDGTTIPPSQTLPTIIGGNSIRGKEVLIDYELQESMSNLPDFFEGLTISKNRPYKYSVYNSDGSRVYNDDGSEKSSILFDTKTSELPYGFTEIEENTDVYLRYPNGFEVLLKDVYVYEFEGNGQRYMFSDEVYLDGVLTPTEDVSKSNDSFVGHFELKVPRGKIHWKRDYGFEY